MCLDGQFPVGVPEILVSKRSLANVSFRDGKTYFEDREIQGIISVSILANPHLKWPFLQQRHEVNERARANIFLTRRGVIIFYFRENPCPHYVARA